MVSTPGAVPERLADALDGLLADEGARLAQANAAGEALSRLGLGGPSPSSRAAGVVLDLIGRVDQPRVSSGM